MTREQAYRIAGLEVGLTAFRASCRMADYEGGPMPAWKVPGTPEAGRESMLVHRAAEITDTIMRVAGDREICWCCAGGHVVYRTGSGVWLEGDSQILHELGISETSLPEIQTCGCND